MKYSYREKDKSKSTVSDFNAVTSATEKIKQAKNWVDKEMKDLNNQQKT